MASMEEQGRGWYNAVKRRKWMLRESKGKSSYQGLEEDLGNTRYCVLALSGNECRAVPIDKWFRFTQESTSKALTLEEAEAEMAKRKSLKKGYQRWMLRATEAGKASVSDDDLSEVEDDGDEDEERKKRATAGGDGSAAASDKKNTATVKKVKVKKEEDLDEEEDREDWEHEEAASDDEEGVGNNPFEKEELEPVAPKTLKEEEDNEEKVWLA